jgi:hypothetical protein
MIAIASSYLYDKSPNYPNIQYLVGGLMTTPAAVTLAFTGRFGLTVVAESGKNTKLKNAIF